MKIALIILFFTLHNSKSDALLDAIYADWGISKMESTPEYSDQEIPDDYEVEVLHWELGTPDNIPETIIIYDSPRCWCE